MLDLGEEYRFYSSLICSRSLIDWNHHVLIIIMYCVKTRLDIVDELCSHEAVWPACPFRTNLSDNFANFNINFHLSETAANFSSSFILSRSVSHFHITQNAPAVRPAKNCHFISLQEIMASSSSYRTWTSLSHIHIFLVIL